MAKLYFIYIKMSELKGILSLTSDIDRREDDNVR